MYCTNCGQYLNDNCKFCWNCGATVQQQIALVTPPNQVPAQANQVPMHTSPMYAQSNQTIYANSYTQGAGRTKKRKSKMPVVVAVSVVCVLVVALICGGLLFFNNRRMENANPAGVNDRERYLEKTRTTEVEPTAHSKFIYEEYYNNVGKVYKICEMSEDDVDEINILYDSENRINGFSATSDGDTEKITLNSYEEEGGIFVSTTLIEEGARIVIKYDTNGKIMEFYSYDKNGKLSNCRIYSYYDDGTVKSEEEKLITDYSRVKYYNKSGDLIRFEASWNDYDYEEEYTDFYEFKNKRYYTNSIGEGYRDTGVGYEEVKMTRQFEEQGDKLKITCFENGVFTRYIICEFDENGNVTKEASYNSDDELTYECIYTWQKK